MDWRRKNSSSISQVFSIPRFTKLKQFRQKNKSQPSTTHRKTKSDYQDSESYWQISFVDKKENDEGDGIEVAEKVDDQNFTEMVCNLRNLRGLGSEDGGKTPVQTPGRRIKKSRKPVKMESPQISQRPSYSNLDCELMEATMQLEKEYECSRNARQTDLEIKSANNTKANTGPHLLKSERDRKSVYIREGQKSRAKPSCKVKVHSPRTPPKVIKALEDIEKERAKKKDGSVVKRAGLERFAVTKSTYDPQKDFRDSMMEMIVEEGIRKPEELENLLACYLTLNSDEYHDFIVSAFRQVWLMYINLVDV